MKHALSWVLCGFPAAALHVRCRSACRRTSGRPVVALTMTGVLLAVILGLGLRVNLSESAPRGLYRTLIGSPTRGVWVVACVGPHAAALARSRGYLGPGPGAG